MSFACDAEPVDALRELTFSGDTDTTSAAFEVHYAQTLNDLVAEHGVVAIHAEVTGGDGMKVSFFDAVPLGFACVDASGRVQMRSSRIAGVPEKYEDIDGRAPDATSSSVKSSSVSSRPWRDEPSAFEAATVELAWDDDCPEASPTVRLVVETAPQAQMNPDAACGDDGFGNAAWLADYHFGDREIGLDSSGMVFINLSKRGEPLSASAQTWALDGVCRTRDPFAPRVEPIRGILDLSEQGLVPVPAL